MTATLRDCVYGQAIGDALGVPFEFRPRDSYECSDMIGYGTHRQPAGTWEHRLNKVWTQRPETTSIRATMNTQTTSCL